MDKIDITHGLCTMNHQYHIEMSLKFKIVVVGDGGVGKTAFIHRHLTGNFVKIYDPTMGVEVHPLIFHLKDKRVVTLNIWDCAGLDKYQGLADGYAIGSSGALIMFDVTKRTSYDRVRHHYNQLKRVFKDQDIPMVLCGNKVDLAGERVVKPRDVRFHQGKDMEYYDVSVRSNYNFDKPFLYLIRKLLGDDTIEFGFAPEPMKKDPEMKWHAREQPEDGDEYVTPYNSDDEKEPEDKEYDGSLEAHDKALHDYEDNR